MDDRKIFQKTDSRVYIIAFVILDIIMWFVKPYLGLLGLVVFGYLIYYSYNLVSEKNDKMELYIERLSDNFESATKHAIFNMPFPLVMLNEKGIINWYNTPFIDMIVEDDILEIELEELIEDFKLSKILDMEEGETLEIKYEDKDYLVYPNYINNKSSISNGEKIILLYWVDNTEYVELKTDYEDDKSTVALVYVDNYEDVKNNTLDVNRPMVLAEIDRRVRDYFAEYNGLVRKYENNKYLVLMNQKALREIQERKFDLLDDMRELDMGNKIPITLSIGVCSEDGDILKSHKNARAAIDIALGRGGDQAVINKNGTFDFYGGKSKALEKRNKVKARVIGYALKQLIDQADKVFIMGHINADMDSLGSAIGVLRGVKSVGKEGYIVLNSENPSIKNIFKRLREVQPELMDDIVTGSRAQEDISRDSLLILVDNHKPSFTEEPELLNMVDKVVVIDHHRRGTEFVEDPVLTYLEPYASSASELVTEILSYMSDSNETGLTKFEAEALLAGITVDTKNFSFQTGVRTFEAASLLKRAGADTTSVRQLFRDDYETFVHRADVIKSSNIYFEKVAVGKLDVEIEDSLLIAAQSANELLDINDVEASFVLTHVDERIHISGRSLGNISVQLILEELGGGGHLTSAGAQVSDKTIDEVEEVLLEAIEKHLEEGGE